MLKSTVRLLKAGIIRDVMAVGNIRKLVVAENSKSSIYNALAKILSGRKRLIRKSGIWGKDESNDKTITLGCFRRAFLRVLMLSLIQKAAPIAHRLL